RSELVRWTLRARAAARDVMGTVETTAIDARTTSVGLGYLVEKLALAADSGADLAELVRISHGIIPKIYGVFFIESMDYLEHSGRVGPAQAALGEMLGIKPVLTLEDGEIMPMEKVRTRGQGIEKLIEFAGEFTSLDRLTVLHSYPNGGAETRLLLDRLAAEFPSVNCPTVLFKPSLAAQIGPHGLGVVVCEGPEDEGEL
ncbi:MAG: DegV family protein, partial [Anaerolineales bacterium]